MVERLAAERVREHDGTVVDVIHRLYSAYGERAAFDSHLHPEITIWETDRPAGLIGLAELDALRDQRTAEVSSLPRLDVGDVVVDRWGDDVAVARYALRARSDTGTTTFRVTDVLTSVHDAWRIVHHHSELIGGPPRVDDQPVSAGHARGTSI